MFAPNSEVIIPGQFRQRRPANPQMLDSHLRILEPTNTVKLLDKGLCVARTLVNVEASDTVPVRILNLSDEPQTLGANTTVAIAKS